MKNIIIALLIVMISVICTVFYGKIRLIINNIDEAIVKNLDKLIS